MMFDRETRLPDIANGDVMKSSGQGQDDLHTLVIFDVLERKELRFCKMFCAAIN